MRNDNDADPSGDDTKTHADVADEAACIAKFKEDLLTNIAYEFKGTNCKIFSGFKKLKTADDAGNKCQIASF